MSGYLKHPQASIDYAIDWPAATIGLGVVQSLWSVTPVEPGGVAIGATTIDDGRTTATISGGVGGRSYRVTNRVTTVAGKIDARTITLRIEAR